KQATDELAQLQKLSLANSNKQTLDKQQSTQPAPLFVIEHQSVVPPLQKQLSGSDKPKSNGDKAKHHQQPEQKKTVTKNVSVNKEAHQPMQKEVKPSSSTTKEKTTQTIARTPALVSMNNEPIPHKRRRRTPSVASSASNEPASKTATKYAKKAPKPATQSNGKANTKVEKTVEHAEATAGNKSENKASTNKATTPAKARKPA
ncbi:polynucleotide adenylyltransferase PcnB, partial [Psychrobacter sp. 1U2]